MSEDDYVEMTMADFEKMLDDMTTRELQKETARAISTMPADNDSIYKFNKVARHNSLLWYKAVITYYVSEWGGLPSEVGPGAEVTLVLD
ncbi:hypothetical protein N8072_00235 [bacterium]|jgi:hypothetical protein|nr:hypothetical protein [bacterium]MDB4128656.1 hypothetical protein [bacterium]MDC1257088.1 hypothetical protein [bacterium]